MNTRIQVETDTCPLVFDPHQDLDWMRSVIERERSSVSHVLLGGEYFGMFSEPTSCVGRGDGRLCEGLGWILG
jgi:hypothetical protein